MRISAVLTLGAILTVLSGCGGQRYVHVKVELDGKPILTDEFSFPDRYAPEDGWARLENAAFSQTDDFPQEQADEGRLDLKGTIKIKMLHGKGPFAEVAVAELKLKPHPDRENTWQLAEGEMERTRELLK